MKKWIEIPVGARFGRITVTGKPEQCRTSGGHTTYRYPCRCDCGHEWTVNKYYLLYGRTVSCGCYSAEMAGARFRKHFGPRRVIRTWNNILTRCYHPSAPNYKQYGGRGIHVCPEWKDNFDNFRDWALANGYADNLSIERVDNAAGYCPSNCRWATRSEQQRNTRYNHLVTAFGETKCIQAWYEDSRCAVNNYVRILARLQAGWPPERAITEPPHLYRQRFRKERLEITEI